MKNTLSDLNNHLFAQLERLSDEDLKGDDLKAEISRSKSVTDVAAKIVDNARVQLEAAKLLHLGDVPKTGINKLLGEKTEE